MAPRPTTLLVVAAAASADTLTIDATSNVVITGAHASATSNTALLAILPSCTGDTNGNGFVDFDDLNEVLSNWNTTCP